MEKIALYGGEKTKTTPYGTGKRFGKEELALLEEALEQNTLFYWRGNMTRRFCKKFADMYGAKYCAASSSGTASIHVALGAVGVGPGDEVITSPITDMGSVIGILAQNAVPIFADLDPNAYNMTPESVAAKITDKTKAIVVVHLAGNACEIDKIVELAHARGIYVIEDCAQAYGCKYKGKYVGTFGDIGCYSLNDFKHISAGDGGMILTDSEEFYHNAVMFADKNYNRFGEEVAKNVSTLGFNYRINELTAAVAIAQLDKVEDICAKRHAYGEKLNEALQGIPGLYPHKILPDCECSYWFYMLRINAEEFGADRNEFAKALQAEGVPAGAGYIPYCVYRYDMFKNRTAYPGGSHYPFGDTQYNEGDCPVAEEILETAVKLVVNEFYTQQDLEDTVKAIRKVCAYFAARKEGKV